jgi:hypothetical protein
VRQRLDHTIERVPLPDHLAPLLDAQLAFERADQACAEAAARGDGTALADLRDQRAKLLHELLRARAAAGITRHAETAQLKREALAELWFESEPQPAGPADAEVLNKAVKHDLAHAQLPGEYTQLLYWRNGGLPRRRTFTGPGGDVEVGRLLGIATADPANSARLHRDEEHPHAPARIAVFAAAGPGGAETFLAYDGPTPTGAPAVVHGDPFQGQRIADSFSRFLALLRLPS